MSRRPRGLHTNIMDVSRKMNLDKSRFDANAGRMGSLAGSRCVVAFLLLLTAMASLDAAETSSSIWLVSTREGAHCGELDSTLQSLRYWRYDNCGWQSADESEFRKSDDMPTVVFIHGNRTDADYAVTKGWYAYNIIRSCVSCQRFRYVIWSWPAERVCRKVVPDSRLKADYSDAESYYLAHWLHRIRPGSKVSLVGHSFGPRIITGALHLLGGGEIDCRRLPSETVQAWSSGKRNKIRAVLLAAALDADWLAPGGCHDRAISMAERMLITTNCRDRVLRLYPRISDCGWQQAMGAIGPTGIGNPSNVEVIDVSGTVGKIHDWRDYCSATNVCSRWATYTFLGD